MNSTKHLTVFYMSGPVIDTFIYKERVRYRETERERDNI